MLWLVRGEGVVRTFTLGAAAALIALTAACQTGPTDSRGNPMSIEERAVDVSQSTFRYPDFVIASYTDYVFKLRDNRDPIETITFGPAKSRIHTEHLLGKVRAYNTQVMERYLTPTQFAADLKRHENQTISESAVKVIGGPRTPVAGTMGYYTRSGINCVAGQVVAQTNLRTSAIAHHGRRHNSIIRLNHCSEVVEEIAALAAFLKDPPLVEDRNAYAARTMSLVGLSGSGG